MNGFEKKRSCTHRELCATRIVINPWHDRTTFHLFPINESHNNNNTSTSLPRTHDQSTENADDPHESEEIITTNGNKKDGITGLTAVTEEERQDSNHHDVNTNNDSPSPPPPPLNSKFHAESRSSISSSISRNTSSFATAYTSSTRTTTTSNSYGATDENDDDIDYQVLRQPLPQLDDSAPASSTASIRTIRPAKKDEHNKFGATPSMTTEDDDEEDGFDKETTTTTTMTSSSRGSISSSSKPSSRHLSTLQQVQEENEQDEDEEQKEGEEQPLLPSVRESQKTPLYWKSSGAIFMPPEARASFVARERRFMGQDDQPQEKPVVLKHDVLLCKKIIGVHGVDNQPTRYKASRESKNQKEEWKQLQAELTSTTLSLYSSSPLIWPCRRLEHQVKLREDHNQCNLHHYNTFRHHTKYLRLYLHSPLDYTFCIRYPYKQSREECITLTFRARSMTLSQEWYLALYKILPEQCKPVCSPWCEVNIPMMDLQVRLPLVKMEGGNNNNNNPMDLLRYDISLESVKHAVLAVLEKSQVTNSSTNWSVLDKEDLAMCWTRGNRTEWTYWTHSLLDQSRNINHVISPQHIEQTHRLELRQIEHTPNHIVFADKKNMKEPHPVEGFLYRLSTFSGKPIPAGSLSRRRHYFASFDQYLFCISSTHGLKPPDQQCYEHPLTDDTCIATVSPFTIRTMEDEEGQDLAEREIQRRMHLMTEASRVIDLTEISHVQRSFGDDDGDQDDNNDITDANDSGTIGLNSPSPQQLEDQIAASRSNSVAASILRIQQEEMLRTSSARQRQRNPILEIIMENGLIIRLKADSSEACDAWVQNLAYLTLYWRARKEAQRNINAKHDYTHMFDEDFRYAITHQEKGSDFNKPPVVDTRIWSICCFEQCRDIVKTGVMYFQPRSRGTFSQKIFVLTGNGWLIYYNIYDRAAVTCQPIQAAVHDRKDAVDITGCYIYSSPSPRRPARIFPDGIASADANDDSLFSLWKPQSRRVFSPKRQRIQVYKHHRTFFQEDGETWQFLAKNRHEKEEWVWAFNVIIERLLRGGVSQ